MTDAPAAAASEATATPEFLFKRSTIAPKMKGTPTFKNLDATRRPTARVTRLLI